MEGSKFWLIYIQENTVSVSLASNIEGKFQVVAVGPQKEWDQTSEESLISSVDESLSVASLNANITEEEEPSSAAFVVPPFWVGNDGKILPQKIKYIKELCKKMSFTPTGFLAEDEALVEDSNKSDSFPSSFILVHLGIQEFYLSLVYLGHIKERIRKEFTGEFNGQILESAILEIKTESTLPPRIIIFGQVDNNLLTSIKDYPWIGKKNVETFLHLPEINLYQNNDLITTFTRVITGQLSGNLPKNNQISSLDEDQIALDEENSKEAVLDQQPPISASELELVEASPEDFGFNIQNDEVEATNSIITNQIPEPNLDPFEPPVILPTISPGQINPKTSKINFHFPKKITFPIFKFNFNFFWIVLIVLPFLALIPFVISSANIILFVNPYKFEKTVSVTLKTDASASDITSGIIPVGKETFDVDATTTVETTGQKTIGEKAKGEIIV